HVHAGADGVEVREGAAEAALLGEDADRGGAGGRVGGGELGRLGDLGEGALGGAGALDLGDQAHGAAVTAQAGGGVEGGGRGAGAAIDLRLGDGVPSRGEVLPHTDDDVVENGSGGGHTGLLQQIGAGRCRHGRRRVRRAPAGSQPPA